jgi:hypothetical protein|tara:strand:+ start:211 stop:327 length:117 start_codon:yes stop_codon:yes gene_type:complete
MFISQSNILQINMARQLQEEPNGIVNAKLGIQKREFLV